MSDIWKIIKVEFIKEFNLKKFLFTLVSVMLIIICFNYINGIKTSSAINYDLIISNYKKQIQSYDEITDNSDFVDVEILKLKIEALELQKDYGIIDENDWRFFVLDSIKSFKEQLIILDVIIDKNDYSFEEAQIYSNYSFNELEDLREEIKLTINEYQKIVNDNKYYVFVEKISNPEIEQDIEEITKLLNSDNNELGYSKAELKEKLKVLDFTSKANKIIIKNKIENIDSWQYKEHRQVIQLISDFQIYPISEDRFLESENEVRIYGSYRNYIEYIEKTKEELNGKIELSLYSLENNIPLDNTTQNIDNGYSTSKHIINNIFPLSIFVMIFLAFKSGNILAKEHSDGSIRLLLIKPIRRWKFILGKFLYLILFAIYIYIMFLIGSIVYSGIIYGFNDMFLPKLIFIDNRIVEINYLWWVLKNMCICFIPMIFISSFIMLLSVITLNVNIVVGISIIISALSSFILKFIVEYRLVFFKFIPFSYLNLSDFIMNNNLIFKALINNGISLNLGLFILIISSIICYIISHIVYVKKDITN